MGSGGNLGGGAINADKKSCGGTIFFITFHRLWCIVQL